MLLINIFKLNMTFVLDTEPTEVFFESATFPGVEGSSVQVNVTRTGNLFRCSTVSKLQTCTCKMQTYSTRLAALLC